MAYSFNGGELEASVVTAFSENSNRKAIRKYVESARSRAYEYIAIHCSATKAGQKVTVDDIDAWHKARGFAEIGYHFVIYEDGMIMKGRELWKAGAHVSGYNGVSIGVCYVGGLDSKGKAADTRTKAQKDSMEWLLKLLLENHRTVRRIQGHKDYPNVNKACPCFNAVKEYKHLLNK